MPKYLLLDPIQILKGEDHQLISDAVLISNGYIKAFGEEARAIGRELNLNSTSAKEQLIAPCLVDPHSVLEDPLNGKYENLESLSKKAASSGYGQVALLPKGLRWRDNPDQIQKLNASENEVEIHFLGSFSKGGKGKDIAPHADMLQYGAIGIAEFDSIPSTELLRKGILLNEIGDKPLFLSPRDPIIQGNGIVREGIETLRAGWAPDPIESEVIPLCQILELQKEYPKASLRVMNLSTSTSVETLEKSEVQPMSSVCWWHLIADSSILSPSDIGWRVSPSLGTPQDRRGLIKGLQNGTLTGVSVNAIALGDPEVKRPAEERLPGLSGYHLVLPMLWNELVVKSGWSIEKLWQAISFGPSEMLNSPKESLCIGSKRWLIFDPNHSWVQLINRKQRMVASNEPLEGKEILGKVIECGIRG
tara:strand:+ start:30096 stop:31352 length:1257 start_codon:yes stop_codon:yes gene_type:complete